jgi:hypothetical protein
VQQRQRSVAALKRRAAAMGFKVTPLGSTGVMRGTLRA